jgi:hypothetical protein
MLWCQDALIVPLSLLFVITSGCAGEGSAGGTETGIGDGDGSGEGDGDGDGSGDGDGDGDGTGDGDGDGDGDGAGDGDGDGDGTGDGDGDGDGAGDGDGDGDGSPGPEDSYEPGECPTPNFQDVSQDDPPDGYPDPFLEVTCEGNEVTVFSNGIPNFEYFQVTPNVLEEQDYAWRFPLNPTQANQTGEIPLGGPSAVSINGLPIFGPTEAPQDGYNDPILDELLDYCGGHTAPGGVYHYHFRPECIYEEEDGSVSIIVGYSFDGYPIFGPWACDDAQCDTVSKMQSSWQPSGEPNPASSWEQNEYVEGLGDLDECNGRIGADGNYRYYATDTFPYFMGCYRGTPTNNGGGGGMP